MVLYAITGGDRSRTPEDLIADARRWAARGVDYVQLREKWMDTGALVNLAKVMMNVFRENENQAKLLINGRADVAVAAGASGVHLTSRVGELTVEQVRRVYRAGGLGVPFVSASCHSLEEVRRLRDEGVDAVVFGPVFGKAVMGGTTLRGVGLAALGEACSVAGATPVLALGGVTEQNSGSCIDAGAAGVAGIRLFA